MSTGTASVDLHALYEALDAQRRSRGLTWSQAAREIGYLSTSTLTGMRDRAVAEGDGVLQMLRWLGRSPESFVPGHALAQTPAAALPSGERLQVLRFDTLSVYKALEAERLSRRLTWRQVASEIGIANAKSVTRLATGGRVAFPEIMHVVAWLGRTAASFTHFSSEGVAPRSRRQRGQEGRQTQT